MDEKMKLFLKEFKALREKYNVEIEFSVYTDRTMAFDKDTGKEYEIYED